MADKLIKNPTYFEHIRHFFDDVDLDHMMQKGFDLSTYESLKFYDTEVLFQTEPPDANMPPKKSRKWSRQRWGTFKNWITTGHPIGTPEPVEPKKVKVERLRKDVDSLSPEEIKLLKKAFLGIMDLEIDNSKSYFALAAIHWFPDKNRCQHHVDKYHPWHRAYLIEFEDALRSVEGCDEVTLPYWDVTKPPPVFLFKKPFSKYTFPIDVSSKATHKAGEDTKRYSKSKIVSNLKKLDVAGLIADGMVKPIWNNFNNYQDRSVVAAHDSGHGAMGPSQFDSDVAAFDPIFWFFHSNWDRLWWEWQMAMQATTYWGFRSTIHGSTTFLEPGLNDLKPFSRTVPDTLDSHKLGIGYERKSKSLVSSFESTPNGSILANKKMRISTQAKTSVRLKGIDRMKIPGGFEAQLKADGEIISRRFFFQSSDPEQCDNCRRDAIVNLDFEVPVESILGKSLDVELHLPNSPDGLSTRFPLHSAGNPTLNARILLEGD